MLKNLSLKQKVSQVLLVAGLLIAGMNASAQEANFKMNGKPLIQIFSHYKSNLGGAKGSESFEEMALSRAALGYKANLSSHFSLVAVMDILNEDGVYKPYFKLGALTYKNNKWQVDVGLIKTKQYKVVQEGFWSYRYIYKSFQDIYKYNASVDMGLSVTYKALDFLSVDAIIQNGEGFKNIRPNSALRFGGGITLDPYKPIIVRLYYDNTTKSGVSRESFSAFLGYKYKKKFRIGGEYNYQKNNGLVEDHDLFGYSIYGRYNITNKISLFARYDQHNSNVIDETIDELAWNVKKDGSIVIAGFDYQVVKNVFASLNYRYQMFEKTDKEALNWLFLNLQFKL